jgi:hypothetical protein
MHILESSLCGFHVETQPLYDRGLGKLLDTMPVIHEPPPSHTCGWGSRKLDDSTKVTSSSLLVLPIRRRLFQTSPPRLSLQTGYMQLTAEVYGILVEYTHTHMYTCSNSANSGTPPSLSPF